jgi:hypothetical protein
LSTENETLKERVIVYIDGFLLEIEIKVSSDNENLSAIYENFLFNKKWKFKIGNVFCFANIDI